MSTVKIFQTTIKLSEITAITGLSTWTDDYSLHAGWKFTISLSGSKEPLIFTVRTSAMAEKLSDWIRNELIPAFKKSQLEEYGSFDTTFYSLTRDKGIDYEIQRRTKLAKEMNLQFDVFNIVSYTRPGLNDGCIVMYKTRYSSTTHLEFHVDKRIIAWEESKYFSSGTAVYGEIPKEFYPSEKQKNE